MEVRKCSGCGKTHPSTYFQAVTHVLADGTRKKYRKSECNSCRQFRRNGGRFSKPKIGPPQTLVEVGGKTCKQCATCKKTKEIGEFTKSSRTVTGFAYTCAKCRSAQRATDYARDPVKANAIKRAWDAKNVEKVRQQEKIRHQRYYAKPEVRERHREYGKQYKLKNPEKEVAASKKRAGELTDAYVRHLLCAGGGGKHIPKSKWPEIPPQLIEVKRAQLKLLHRIKGKG